ncbi:MAG: hypothetical protein MJK04_29435, partial [Psychrosphaera sp.]|nr:hypothetical protein [Psychrosphaera sp.]
MNASNAANQQPLTGLVDSTDNNQRQIQLQISQAIIEGTGKTIESQWQKIIRQHSRLLERLIRYHGKQTSVRKRLVRGFLDSMLTDIVVVLEPVEHAFVRQIIDNGSRIFNLENAPPSDTEKQRRTHLWEFTLGYLLVDRGSEFNKKSYLGSLTRQMAAHNNMQYPQLLVSLSQTLQNFEGAAALKQQLQQILQVLGEQAGLELAVVGGVVEGIAEQSDKGEQTHQSEQSYYPDLAKWHPMASGLALDQSSNRSSNKKSVKLSLEDQQLLRQLVEAIVLGDAKVIEPLWSRLTKSHARLVMAILVHYGQLAEVRHQMAIGFTERLLMDVVHLLAPAALGFVETVMINRVLFGVTLDVTTAQTINETEAVVQVNIATDAVALKHSLWEFTLAYLLVERGSQFNTKSYLGSLIRQMAAHRNLHYQTLLMAMVQALATINVVGGLKSDLLVLLQQLHMQTSFDTDKIAAQQKAHETK